MYVLFSIIVYLFAKFNSDVALASQYSYHHVNNAKNPQNISSFNLINGPSVSLFQCGWPRLVVLQLACIEIFNNRASWCNIRSSTLRHEWRYRRPILQHPHTLTAGYDLVTPIVLPVSMYGGNPLASGDTSALSRNPLGFTQYHSHNKAFVTFCRMSTSTLAPMMGI